MQKSIWLKKKINDKTSLILLLVWTINFLWRWFKYWKTAIFFTLTELILFHPSDDTKTFETFNHWFRQNSVRFKRKIEFTKNERWIMINLHWLWKIEYNKFLNMHLIHSFARTFFCKNICIGLLLILLARIQFHKQYGKGRGVGW